MAEHWTHEPAADLLLEHDALGAPEWLSDEECLHEIGSDWSRRRCGHGEGEEEF